MERGDRKALVAIVIGNVVTIAIAVWQQWSPLLMMWPYWIQSLAIGWYNARRMLALRRFSTAGLTKGKPMPENRGVQIATVVFFAVHYGFFHLGYLAFLAVFTISSLRGGEAMGANAAPMSTEDFLMALGLGLLFFWSHRTAYREQLHADLAGKPDLGTMMSLPYLRVIPMHVMVIFGAFFGGAGAGSVFFGVLKTIADVGMHHVEHRVLRAPRKTPA